MSPREAWAALPTDVREFVEKTLGAYPLQLEAWRLRYCGRSWREIALIQGVTRSTVRDRLASADHRLVKAGLRQNAYGRFSIKSAA